MVMALPVLYHTSVDTGVYHLADPEQIRRFVSFVDKEPPYDVVVDGLNAIHMPPGATKKEAQLYINGVSSLQPLVTRGETFRYLGAITQWSSSYLHESNCWEWCEN